MTKNKPIIGIPGSKNYSGDFFGGGINHLEYISKYGNPRIIFPWEKKVDIDLLYLPGGLDLSPANYGRIPSFKTSNTDVMKDFFYRKRLVNYINDTPIFGVCLGMQMLGAYFGSKMTQDLLFHPDSPDRWQVAHSVVLHAADGEDEEIEVNSHHHQAILGYDLSEELEVLATAECEEPFQPDDEFIVEAFQHKTLPIAGVQWHPEELYDDFSENLINKLLTK